MFPGVDGNSIMYLQSVALLQAQEQGTGKDLATLGPQQASQYISNSWGGKQYVIKKLQEFNGY